MWRLNPEGLTAWSHRVFTTERRHNLLLLSHKRASIEHLWQRAASPEGPERLGLPMRCDKPWFCKVDVH